MPSDDSEVRASEFHLRGQTPHRLSWDRHCDPNKNDILFIPDNDDAEFQFHAYSTKLDNIHWPFFLMVMKEDKGCLGTQRVCTGVIHRRIHGDDAKQMANRSFDFSVVFFTYTLI